jgi:hypothetical protein
MYAFPANDDIGQTSADHKCSGLFQAEATSEPAMTLHAESATFLENLRLLMRRDMEGEFQNAPRRFNHQPMRTILDPYSYRFWLHPVAATPASRESLEARHTLNRAVRFLGTTT